MKTLKKLFSPRNLATTIATGMLLHSAVNVLAAGYYQVSACAVGHPACVQCGSGHECRQLYQDTWYFWCCWAGDNCVYPSFQPTNYPYGTAWSYSPD